MFIGNTDIFCIKGSPIRPHTQLNFNDDADDNVGVDDRDSLKSS